MGLEDVDQVPRVQTPTKAYTAFFQCDICHEEILKEPNEFMDMFSSKSSILCMIIVT